MIDSRSSGDVPPYCLRHVLQRFVVVHVFYLKGLRLDIVKKTIVKSNLFFLNWVVMLFWYWENVVVLSAVYSTDVKVSPEVRKATNLRNMVGCAPQ